MVTKIEIGLRLKEERERLRLSQTSFAGLANSTQNTQYLYESGKRMPDAIYLSSVAIAGVDVSYVLTGGKSANAAITPMEVALLDNYRASAPEVQDGVSKLLASTGKAVERADALSVIAKVKVAQQKGKNEDPCDSFRPE